MVHPSIEIVEPDDHWVAAPEHKPSALKSLREAARELWVYRQLLYQLTLRDVRIRYKQAVMGFAWAFLMPAVVVLAGVVVRYAMARFAGNSLETAEITGMAVKAVPWAYFVGAIGFAVNSLTGNAALVGKVYFPREVLPVSTTLAQTFDSTIGAIALALVLPFLGVKFSMAMLWLPLLVILLFTITVATCLFLSCANLFFRDVKYIVRVLTTFGIFFTPIFFEPVMFGPRGAILMMLNPLAPIVEGFRLSLIQGHNLASSLVTMSGGAEIVIWSPWYLVYSSVFCLMFLMGSSLMFHRLEFVFAEYV